MEGIVCAMARMLCSPITQHSRGGCAQTPVIPQTCKGCFLAVLKSPRRHPQKEQGALGRGPAKGTNGIIPGPGYSRKQVACRMCKSVVSEVAIRNSGALSQFLLSN